MKIFFLLLLAIALHIGSGAHPYVIASKITWHLSVDSNDSTKFSITADAGNELVNVIYSKLRFVVDFNNPNGALIKRDTLYFDKDNELIELKSGDTKTKKFQHDYGANVKITAVNLLYSRRVLGGKLLPP